MAICDGKCLGSALIKKLSREINFLRTEFPEINGTRLGRGEDMCAVFEVTVTSKLSARRREMFFKKVGEQFFNFRESHPRFLGKSGKNK